MIHGKNVLAIIPARGGSKGLPGKNIRPMCGKPLIAWSIEKAQQSRYIDMVLISTDSLEIAGVAKRYGAHVPFIRPDVLATDHASTYDVIRHALNFLDENECKRFDLVVLLEPTSPLREDGDIDNMLEKLAVNYENFDSIVSVGEVDEHPSIMKRLTGDTLSPFCPDLAQTTRRQANEPAYFPYGVAYIAKTQALLAENTFYTLRCTYFKIKKYQNYEIDDLYGFLCTESVMRHEWSLE